MRISRRHVAVAAGSALALASAPPSARAGWPDRPIRVIVPFAAGGNVDIVARLIGPSLAERLGQPVVVENRAGAGGSIGAEAVARARADGNTLLMGSNGPLTVNPVVQARLPYDPARDFDPVGLAMQVPHALIVGAALPVRSVAELIAYATARPGQLGVGTAGTASATHLTLELFNGATGAGLTHVPYRGAGAAVPDFVSGTLALLCVELSTALPLHREGKGRILAIGSARRLAMLPEVPTLIEAGVPGLIAASFVGLLAPTGTREEAMGPLTRALAVTLREPAVRERFAAMGGEAATDEEATPQGFAAFLRGEADRARRAAEIAGIKPE